MHHGCSRSRSSAGASAARLAWLAATALVIGGASRAHADPDTAKLKHADQLFAEGKALLETDLEAACGKFDESLRENPAAIGTLLNVARCDEKRGRIASAVAKFSEARDRALERRLREHVRVASEYITRLTPLIPHLAITLATPAAGAVVLVDDRVISPQNLGDVTVDPGKHVVVVTAPNRVSYRATIDVDAGERRAIEIPTLAPAVITSSQRRIGQLLTLGGTVAAGGGVGLGLYARHLYRSQFGTDGANGMTPCNASGCSARGQSRTERARTLGNVGTVVGLVGVAVAGVGGYLWWRAPGPHPTEPAEQRRLTVIPAVGADSIGVAALGEF